MALMLGCYKDSARAVQTAPGESGHAIHLGAVQRKLDLRLAPRFVLPMRP